MTKLWLAVCAVSAVGAVGLLIVMSSEPMIADASDTEMVILGEEVYANNCASCHGDKLEGQPNWQVRDDEGYLPAPPHDETGHTWHHADSLLFQIIKNGTASIAPADYKTRMNNFSDSLTDKEIWASLAFIKSTWSDKERGNQERINRNNQN